VALRKPIRSSGVALAVKRIRAGFSSKPSNNSVCIGGWNWHSLGKFVTHLFQKLVHTI
jgi:hypothetical protein